jgi:hypothetical protein
MTLGKKSVNNNNNVSEAGNGATGNGKIDQRAATQRFQITKTRQKLT